VDTVFLKLSKDTDTYHNTYNDKI